MNKVYTDQIAASTHADLGLRWSHMPINRILFEEAQLLNAFYIDSAEISITG